MRGLSTGLVQTTNADTHTYFWVHAEAFAAAWRWYRHTNEQSYLDDHQRLWMYSWQYFFDHQNGAWFHIRNRDGSAFDNHKSPPGKTDYHTMGPCWDMPAQNCSTTLDNSLLHDANARLRKRSECFEKISVRTL